MRADQEFFCFILGIPKWNESPNMCWLCAEGVMLLAVSTSRPIDSTFCLETEHFHVTVRRLHFFCRTGASGWPEPGPIPQSLGWPNGPASARCRCQDHKEQRRQPAECRWASLPEFFPVRNGFGAEHSGEFTIRLKLERCACWTGPLEFTPILELDGTLDKLPPGPLGQMTSGPSPRAAER